MSEQRTVVLVGLMGAGKSPVGRRVATRLGWPFHDGDEELEARLGITPMALAERDGLPALHAAEAAVLLDLLAAPPPMVIAASASTIEDAVCRDALRAPLVAWLDADPSFLAPRAVANGKRPEFDDLEARLREQGARRAPLYASVADARFDVAVVSLDVIADDIARAVTIH